MNVCDLGNECQLEGSRAAVEKHPSWLPCNRLRIRPRERLQLRFVQPAFFTVQWAAVVDRSEVSKLLELPIRPTLKHAVREVQHVADVLELCGRAVDGAELRDEAVEQAGVWLLGEGSEQVGAKPDGGIYANLFKSLHQRTHPVEDDVAAVADGRHAVIMVSKVDVAEVPQLLGLDRDRR
eukprot:CAMPEP_0177311972 /NCGR_PEP_ID=MMETSP0368-20130122/10639_1 /TAXON_ID=447022 ORGANISM="Scrippsiella hangoei-like, Strain SHHI-4" /NCGR_SAMPLE_ID=MMETSP0368 /ASSEMBLY_ACC=CAM_ASM_000363 /LENGTH=179 /DNA_ID=CAMNT_0018770997 /DNA_START=420 /DNA_END=960 /DNA_ORIENTATION=+